MNPIPFNRHILVLKQEAKEEDTLVLVPDEYKQKSPFTLATVSCIRKPYLDGVVR